MVEIFIIVLLVAWLLGFLSSYTMGGVIHALLLLAMLMAASKLVRRKRRPFSEDMRREG